VLCDELAYTTSLFYKYLTLIVFAMHFVLRSPLSAHCLCNQLRPIAGAYRAGGLPHAAQKHQMPLEPQFFCFCRQSRWCISCRLSLCPLKAVRIPSAIKNKKRTPLIITGYVRNRLYLSANLSHNVLSMRRSSPPYKANRRFAVGWNVGERKPHKA